MKLGEIWIVELPVKGGREQKGIRPCIIFSLTGTSMIVVIPLTSNLQALNFPNTLQINKSNKNNLEKNSVALIFQIVSLDKQRFISKIGDLETEFVNEIKINLKNIFEIN